MTTDLDEKHSTIESGNARIYGQVANELVLDPSSSTANFRLEVISGSMSPFLRPGDKVVVQQARPEAFRIGDLVVARRKGEFITHRLVSIGKDEWYTKGDRCRHLDPPLSKDTIVGKVIEIDREGRTINLQTNYWILTNALLGPVNWWALSLFVILKRIRDRIRRRN
jgi:signal peptidase I